MTYVVKSTEKTRKSASETETKALLYLMNFREDSNEIYYFIVDFFNDLTGMDRLSNKLWDLQSKGQNNNTPKVIGKELVTLFKNFMSSIDFEKYILFLGGVSSTVRIDNSKSIFDITNIKEKARKSIFNGIIDEGKKKEYINSDDLTEVNVNNFLGKVTFVIDDKPSVEYVRAIIKNHPRIMPEDKILQAIFNEIRDKQASKKNENSIDGIVIEAPDEALNYARHLTNNEIRLLTLERILNRNPLEKGIPTPFASIYNSWPVQDQNDLLDDCQRSLCRAIFNKNLAEEFWSLFEKVYETIISYPEETVDGLFRKIDYDYVSVVPDLDTVSFKYFISIIKWGIMQ